MFGIGSIAKGISDAQKEQEERRIKREQAARLAERHGISMEQAEFSLDKARSDREYTEKKRVTDDKYIAGKRKHEEEMRPYEKQRAKAGIGLTKAQTANQYSAISRRNFQTQMDKLNMELKKSKIDPDAIWGAITLRDKAKLATSLNAGKNKKYHITPENIQFKEVDHNGKKEMVVVGKMNNGETFTLPETTAKMLWLNSKMGKRGKGSSSPRERMAQRLVSEGGMSYKDAIQFLNTRHADPKKTRLMLYQKIFNSYLQANAKELDDEKKLTPEQIDKKTKETVEKIMSISGEPTAGKRKAGIQPRSQSRPSLPTNQQLFPGQQAPQFPNPNPAPGSPVQGREGKYDDKYFNRFK